MVVDMEQDRYSSWRGECSRGQQSRAIHVNQIDVRAGDPVADPSHLPAQIEGET